MRGWVVAGVLAGCWAATCVESRRRFEVDGRALEHAVHGLSAGYALGVGLNVGESSRALRLMHVVSTATQHVNAALEARA